MIYISIFNILVIIRFSLRRAAERNYSKYSILLFLLFLFSAFRFEVGCDWTGYFFQYHQQLGGGMGEALSHPDLLWWAMIELTQQAGLSYPWLNVFSSLIFFVGVHVLARRQPDPLAFLILLFPILIVNMPMSGIRQGAAIGLICMALAAFLDRRLVRFVVWTFFASGFHSSSSIFLLLTPFVWGAFTRRQFILAAILSIPGVYLLASGADAEVAFSRYVNTGRDAFGAPFRTGLLFLSGLFFIFFLQRQWRTVFPHDYKLASLGVMMMLIVFPLSAFSTVIADRLGYYFIPIQAMIFARVPYLRHGRSGQFLAATPYIAMALVFVTWVGVSSLFDQCYLPYQPWLFGFPTSSNRPY